MGVTDTHYRAGSSRAQLLCALADPDVDLIGFSSIAERLSMSKKNAKELADRMEEDGLIRVDRDPRGAVCELTRPGEIVAGGVMEGGNGVQGERTGLSDSDNSTKKEFIRVHNVEVSGRIVDRRYDRQGSDWRQVWADTVEREVEHKPEFDGYITVVDGALIRFQREQVFIRLKYDPMGEDVGEAVDAAMRSVRDAIRWVEERAPVDVRRWQLECRALHVAQVNNHLARYIDRADGVELEGFRVYDRDTGRRRLTMDRSTGVPELEAEMPECAESDMREIAQLYSDVVHHPYARRWLYRLGREAVEQGVDPVDVVRAVSERSGAGARVHARGEDFSSSGDMGGYGRSRIREHTGWGWEW